MTAPADQQSYRFQAEVVQILDLMIHSLYSNKEIFLRELISNASDAIDRLRLELLSRSEVPEAEGPLQIQVSFDTAARTVTISDNGIGMSREEVIEHIGTIAKSGTREFLRTLTGDQARDAALIGQFGVGFYSAFIVADRVTLVTRRAGLPPSGAVRWESAGTGEYTLAAAERGSRGTTVVLHLREGEDELLSGPRLRLIIQKYSDHISLPILMPADGEDAGDTVVNQGSALWARPKNEITDQDYREFYRHVTGDLADPVAWVHSKIEGTFEYTLLLFLPSRAPYDLWLPGFRHGVRLHVRRVFIMADTGQLLPGYLRFVRGVIDSADLPLNVSRELLQGSRAVASIRSTAVKRVLRLLADLAENEPEKYAAFYAEFGAALKEGVAEDYANSGEIARLLRFASTRSGGDAPEVSLADYVARMKDGQQEIYYLLAPGLAAAKASPHLEAFAARDVEVLLLGDVIDGWVVSSLREFDGKRLQSVTQGSADLGALDDEGQQEEKEQAKTDFAGLAGRLRHILAAEVSDVRVSSRLTSSPSCIVTDEPDTELSVTRRLRGSGLPAQAVLEINPGHPLVARLRDEQDEQRLAGWAQVLYGQAVLTLGARIEDPAAFVTRLNALLENLTAGASPGETASPEAPAITSAEARHGAAGAQPG